MGCSDGVPLVPPPRVLLGPSPTPHERVLEGTLSRSFSALSALPAKIPLSEQATLREVHKAPSPASSFERAGPSSWWERLQWRFVRAPFCRRCGCFTSWCSYGKAG